MRRRLILVLTFMIACPLFAQYDAPHVIGTPPANDAFGTASEGASAVSFAGFTSIDSSQPYTDGGGNRYGGLLLSSISLPAGALITGVELMACDGNNANQAEVALFQVAPGGFLSLSPYVGSGFPETPGCAAFRYSFPAGGEPVVDSASAYFLVAGSPSADAALTGARVFYRRQVSPGPAVATFADVPTTHGFFKFVEALAAAGITGGCGGGNYCPNNPVTRGQMAVFLASALGLHWPAN